MTLSLSSGGDTKTALRMADFYIVRVWRAIRESPLRIVALIFGRFFRMANTVRTYRLTLKA